MPHAAHLIVARDCQFHLATCVGGYIVSTVGEYLPDEPVREIFAESRRITLVGKGDTRLADYMQKRGFEEIGAGRKYETMVFRSRKSDNKCCPWTAAGWLEIDAKGYNGPDEAYEGHMQMCAKWARKK